MCCGSGHHVAISVGLAFLGGTNVTPFLRSSEAAWRLTSGEMPVA